MLQWNVLNHNIGSDEIVQFNIFDHSGFRKDMREAARNIYDRDEFTKAVRSSLMYYFWSKCEYEVVVSPLGSNPKNIRKKVDVFTQVWNNKDAFIWYCLCNREELASENGVFVVDMVRLVNREDLVIDYQHDGKPSIRISVYNYRGDTEVEETIDLPSIRKELL